MNNQKGHIIIVGMIILFLLLLTGGYFLWRSQQKTLETQSDQTNLSAQTTPQSIDHSSSPENLNAFRTVSKKYWEFSIPKDWNYWECDDKIYVGPQIEKDQVGNCQFDGNPGVVALYKVKTAYKTLEDIIPKSEEHIIEYSNGRKEIIKSPIVSEIKYLMIDGQKAISWQEEVKGQQGEGKYIYAFVLSKSAQFQLDDLNYRDNFYSILSKIKFLY